MRFVLNIIVILFILKVNMAFGALVSLEITNASVRVPVVSSVTVTAAFMTIKNNSDKDLRLIGAKGGIAGYFELHSMEMKDGKMKMRTVDSILLKAKSSTNLETGGLHLMVFDLKEKLKPNNKYTISLILENKEEIEVALVGKAIDESH